MKILTYLPHYGWMFGLASSMPNDTFYIANKLTFKRRTTDLSISNGYWRWLRSIRPKPTNVKLLGQDFSEINTDNYDVVILIPDAGQVELVEQYLNNIPIVWKFHLCNEGTKNVLAEKGIEMLGNFPCIFSAETQKEFYGLDGDVAVGQSPELYKDWSGEIERVMWTCERIGEPKDGRYMQRGGYIWDQIHPYVRAKRYGLDFRLGTPITPFEELIMAYRFNRCYVECATNTILTDGLIEAMMTGMPPVVYANWEMDRIIEHEVNGFKSTNPKDMIKYINHLLENYDLAKQIGKEARKTALKLWNPETAKNIYHEAIKKAIMIHNQKRRTKNKIFPHLIQIYRLKNSTMTDDFFSEMTKRKIEELKLDFNKEYPTILECSHCYKRFRMNHSKGKHFIKSLDGEESIEVEK